jgi:predicted small lipoprotein YifL
MTGCGGSWSPSARSRYANQILDAMAHHARGDAAGTFGAGLICDRLTFALIGAALALSACGRAGPLEKPPGPAMVPASSTEPVQPDAPPGSPQETAPKTGFDTHGNPIAPPGQKRPFFLDPLLF